MKIEEIKNEEWYALFATDGSFQGMTLAPSFEMCVAMIKMLHKAKMSESFHELVKVRGFKIMPIKLTILANGDENKAFERTPTP